MQPVESVEGNSCGCQKRHHTNRIFRVFFASGVLSRKTHDSRMFSGLGAHDNLEGEIGVSIEVNIDNPSKLESCTFIVPTHENQYVLIIKPRTARLHSCNFLTKA